MMKKIGDQLSLLAGVILAVAVMAGVVFNFEGAVAQSPDAQTPPCCLDMWKSYRSQPDAWRPSQMGPGMQHRLARHRSFMHQGVPAAYHGARNPLFADTVAIHEGRILYQENCASCHGAKGMGDGEEAKALSPSPTLLAHMIRMPTAADEYLLWSISDGGEAFGSDMPAFQASLSRNEIWKIVTYMRAGFPVEKTEE